MILYILYSSINAYNYLVKSDIGCMRIDIWVGYDLIIIGIVDLLRDTWHSLTLDLEESHSILSIWHSHCPFTVFAVPGGWAARTEATRGCKSCLEVWRKGSWIDGNCGNQWLTSFQEIISFRRHHVIWMMLISCLQKCYNLFQIPKPLVAGNGGSFAARRLAGALTNHQCISREEKPWWAHRSNKCKLWGAPRTQWFNTSCSYMITYVHIVFFVVGHMMTTYMITIW